MTEEAVESPIALLAPAEVIPVESTPEVTTETVQPSSEVSVRVKPGLRAMYLEPKEEDPEAVKGGVVFGGYLLLVSALSVVVLHNSPHPIVDLNLILEGAAAASGAITGAIVNGLSYSPRLRNIDFYKEGLIEGGLAGGVAGLVLAGAIQAAALSGAATF